MRRTRRPLVIGVVVVVVAGIAVGAYAATPSGGTHYRTAIVTTASVQQTLSETGTAAAATSDDAAFAESGTVATVAVKPGQQVNAGQVLATQQTASLTATLTADEATVADDKLTLQEAEDGEATTTSGSSHTGSSSTGTGAAYTTTTDATSQASALSATYVGEVAADAALVSFTPTPGHSGAPGSGGTSSTSSESLSALQAAVVADQEAVDAGLAQAQRLLTSAGNACGGLTPPPTTAEPTPSATAASPPNDSSSPSVTPPVITPSSGSPTPTPSGSTSANACLTATTALLAVERATSTDESNLASAETALNAKLASTAATLAAEQTTSAASGKSSTLSSASTGTHTTTTTTSTVPSAADLAADQATVDAAQATVTVDQQAITQATLLSPISGTVAEVDITAGSSVSSDSTSDYIEVLNPDAVTYTTDIPVTSIASVKTGDAVTVTPDGSTATLAGKVVSIGIAPDPSSTSTVEFPITIGVTTTTTTVRPGSTASLSLDLAAISAAVTVPTSAVSSLATLHFVEVLKAGKETRTRVTVGVVGPLLTSITSGLTAGEKVVLADMSEPIPSSNTSLTAITRTISGGGGAGGFTRRTAG